MAKVLLIKMNLLLKFACGNKLLRLLLLMLATANVVAVVLFVIKTFQEFLPPAEKSD
jgi:hypothetical protein